MAGRRAAEPASLTESSTEEEEDDVRESRAGRPEEAAEGLDVQCDGASVVLERIGLRLLEGSSRSSRVRMGALSSMTVLSRLDASAARDGLDDVSLKRWRLTLALRPELSIAGGRLSSRSLRDASANSRPRASSLCTFKDRPGVLLALFVPGLSRLMGARLYVYVSGGEKGAFGLKAADEDWNDAATGGRALPVLVGDPPLALVEAADGEEGPAALALGIDDCALVLEL